MAKSLVIVESPAKAKTIGRYLGRDYIVIASVGHVRDLPGGKLGVDVENGFAPQYVVPKDKQPVIREVNEALKKVSTVYLATDPDREGEAIAWHIKEAVKVGDIPVKRVVFHEITEAAIKEAFNHPREIDLDLVNAQQTRRILDRLVGYKLSPVLWKKLRGGLSAGRVQSAALRIVVIREREIEAFVSQEYWRIIAEVSKQGANGTTKKLAFKAILASIEGVKGKLEVGDDAQAQSIVKDLKLATYTVSKVTQRETQRKPTAPFITSTLQQEAWRKLRFAARRTMSVAQQLYEGLAVGSEGTVGLITYMRTDSPVVSAAAMSDARAYIKKKYGAAYVPASPRSYKARSKGAQEAHEAIRPTSVGRDPQSMKPHLSSEQFRLYDLVWKRMVASQMANGVFDATSIQIEAPGPDRTYVLQASGSVQKFAGFLALYAEGRDDDDEEDSSDLPAVENGEVLHLLGLDPQQKFTQPPPRYSEASLVRVLEENGIGRPSTYAPIISTIQDRGYVKKETGTLYPQVLGKMVNDLLQEGFPDIINPKFTAEMEEGLDEIARGEKEWGPFLSEFYAPFEKAITSASENLAKRDEPSTETCDTCGKPMVVKKGRFGLFLACVGYPECKSTKPIQTKIGVQCPLCSEEIVQKRSRKGKTFYGCSSYPKCDFATGLRPIPEPCPDCGGLLGAFPRGGVKCTKCEYKGKRPKAKQDGEAEGEGESEAAEPVAASA